MNKILSLIVIFTLIQGCSPFEESKINDLYAYCFHYGKIPDSKNAIQLSLNERSLNIKSARFVDFSQQKFDELSELGGDDKQKSSFAIYIIIKSKGRDDTILSNIGTDQRLVTASGDKFILTHVANYLTGQGYIYRDRLFSAGSSVPLDFCQ